MHADAVDDAVDPNVCSQPDLPVAYFGFPGRVRDALVGAILDGRKVSTTRLVADYEHGCEPLPHPGQRAVVVDSHDRPVAVIETTAVAPVQLGEVDLAHVVDEGEGFTSLTEWRTAHETFWHSEEMRRALGDLAFTVNDAAPVLLERFRVVQVL